VCAWPRNEPPGAIRFDSLNEWLEVRNVDDRLHVAGKERHPDAWDPLVEPYDSYGPDNGIDLRGHGERGG
jgi:hypothetical protein